MSRLLIVDRGEFGWTLCALLPRARVIAERYTDVRVVTVRGREGLWRDVGYPVLAFDSTPGSQNFLDGQLERLAESYILSATGRVWPSSTDRQLIVRDERDGFRAARFVPSLDKKWGDLVPAPYRAAELVRAACPGGAPQVCIAVRPPKLLGSQTIACKSWPADSVQRLVDELIHAGVRPAIVGGRENLGADGALDLRGVDIETLCAVLAAARVTVGPSSGPLHLSQLCRTPVVTWYGVDAAREGSRNRYLGSWNPWRVPCFYMPDVQPSARDVLVQTLLALEADRSTRSLSCLS